ncbi:NADP-dependent oxidoreductase domain-containing protein [Aspergillus karnatakaensis]|uniref:aldo/keto reductase family protein n=1 Tax=Aspergillus karnatakaensis TaxID=1810916 RepID=UPI003CCD9428
MSTPKINLIFGGASLGGMEAEFTSVASTASALSLLENNGVTTIDTGRIYPNSEHWLGELNATAKFDIDTKYPGGFGTAVSSGEDLKEKLEESLQELKTDQITTYYIHAPDRRPGASTTALLQALTEAHAAGKFKKLGLSNFLVDEVKEILRIAKENNFLLPSVYQGNYNAVARHHEKTLLPLLREHGIAFYAYSPIAGGFLTKSVEQLTSTPDSGSGPGTEKGTRWDPNTQTGTFYTNLYAKPSLFEGLKVWGEIADDAGISKAELAYRWVAFHSALDSNRGDGLVFGARNEGQIWGTLEGLRKGPLPREIAERVEGVWEVVERDAPVDNFNGGV